MSGLITAWSYSRWKTYDTCPLQARFKYVDKIPEEENDAMRGGKEAHDEIAAFIRGDHPGPVRGWEHFQELFEQLRELSPLIEQQWGFTEQWQTTGWFAKGAKATWFRSVLDVCMTYDDNTADIVDHKTGKPYPDHAQQAELYALSVFIRYAHIQRCTVRFWYLDAGDESVYRFARSDMKEIADRWKKKTKKMLSDEIMAPKPGSHCSRCYQAKSNGGRCKYG